MANRWAVLAVSGAIAVGSTAWATADGASAPAPAASAGWSIEPSPNPPGATSTTLTAVSCSSSDSCTAVGDYYDPANDLFTLAEHWNGHLWSIQPTPDAPNVHTNLLNAVSCAGPKSCTAVGYTVTARSAIRALAEQWDGITWTLVPTPLPAGAHSVELNGVSCRAPDACEAVGDYLRNEITGQYQPLAEVWNGSTWTVQPTPNPRAENGSSLSSVSCPAVDTCTAGGNYDYADVAQSIFAFGWNGTNWVDQNQPNPGGNDDNTDNGVSCPLAIACTTVGSWVNAGDQIKTLAEHFDGTRWVRQVTPDPSGADIAELYGVSCAGSSDCTAVGDSATNYDANPTSSLAERWNGTRWAVQATPDPPGAHTSTLDGVDCPTPTTCVAVGASWNGVLTTTLVEVS